MGLSKLESTLAAWKEEVKLGSKETELKPKHIKKLEKLIDAVYKLSHKVHEAEEVAIRYTKELR